MIDKKRLQKNILYFGKLKNLKIGEIEKSVGVRLGLISIWANKQSKDISLETISNIAKLLGVTIDELINTDTNRLEKEKEKNENLTKVIEDFKNKALEKSKWFKMVYQDEDGMKHIYDDKNWVIEKINKILGVDK